MTIHDEYRLKFHDLTDEANAIRAESAPLREKRDEIGLKIQPLEDAKRALEKQIKEIEQPLFDLENERAMMVRALGGKTGIRQEDGSVIMPSKDEPVVEEKTAETEVV